jgi:hypothetical protein
MPQRLLRPGIVNSERWNAVSFEDQSFYIRLLTLVDDYGRYDGRPAVLAGQCFSVWNAQNPGHAIDAAKVELMLSRLASDSVRLIEWYEVEGKKVLQITQWQERIRDGAKEKWPPNPESAAGRCVPLLPTSSSSSSSSSSTTTIGCWADEFGNEIPECLRTARFKEALTRWHQYRREIRKPYKRIGAAGCLKTLAECGSSALAVKTIEQSIGNGWQGLFPLKTQPEEKGKPFIPGGQNY